MKQLLSKEVMYEPMVKMCEEFPRWLAENEGALPKADCERYGRQYQYFQKIIAVYESEPDNHARLVELMEDVGVRACAHTRGRSPLSVCVRVPDARDGPAADGHCEEAGAGAGVLCGRHAGDARTGEVCARCSPAGSASHAAPLVQAGGTGGPPMPGMDPSACAVM